MFEDKESTAVKEKLQIRGYDPKIIAINRLNICYSMAKGDIRCVHVIIGL